MRQRRPPSRAPSAQVEAAPAPTVLGLRDDGLLAAVQVAVTSSGFQVADVVATARQLLAAASYRRPQLIVAALDVLGEDPGRTVRRTLVRCPDTRMVVLSPLDTVPIWLLEAGAEAVIAQTEIDALRRVMRDLRRR